MCYKDTVWGQEIHGHTYTESDELVEDQNATEEDYQAAFKELGVAL